jgi:multiple sugar transport system substrate-binding protein
MINLSVLNWQNRRAVDPVAAAIAAYEKHEPDVRISQVIRPLSDFEHQGIEEVAKNHDIVIFDHPFSGAIEASGCFLALDEELPEETSHGASATYIGPSLETYCFKGHVWGLPIDGATQHALTRHDLLDKLSVEVPINHSDVLALGHKARKTGLYLGTAVETPHALMSVLSYMANLGAPLEANDERLLAIPRDSFEKAFDAVRNVLDLSPPEALDWNSIDLHEQMVARDDIVYAPAVYGYATYGEVDNKNRLGFGAFPGMVKPFHAGTTIGGTAMGVSSSSQNKREALAFARYMASDDIQRQLVATYHGQPGGLIGWSDREMDARYNGFFSKVKSTLDAAWIRPRYKGYVHFQRKGGEIVTRALRNNSAATAVRQELLDLAGIDR